MEFLRKTLVVVFGILSLFFAVVAVLKHVAQSGDKGSETSAYIIDWNSDFRDTAKKAGRPVFLLMTPDTRMLQDPEVSDAIDLVREKTLAAGVLLGGFCAGPFWSDRFMNWKAIGSDVSILAAATRRLIGKK